MLRTHSGKWHSEETVGLSIMDGNAGWQRWYLEVPDSKQPYKVGVEGRQNLHTDCLWD